MTSPILNRRKWRLHAGDHHIVIVKGEQERFVHPLMKALLWGLYIPTYPNMTVEFRIRDKYKPDVIAFAPDDRLRAGRPVFWGEAGQVGRQKIESLVRRYPDVHFAIAKWEMPLAPHIAIVERAIENVARQAPFDVINFTEDSLRFINDDGQITISHADLDWVRL